VSQPRE